MDKKSLTDHPVILFDGVCNLCNSSVQFIIRRDPKSYFRFAALQSDKGRELISLYGQTVADPPDSVILVDANGIHIRTDAALRIAKRLSGLWPAFSLFLILPRWLRDPVYNWIGRNRYRWFGKQDSCMMPDPSLRSRFL